MASSLREEINALHAHICNGLADPIRILILYTLSEQGVSVGELTEKLNLPQPTVSRHLKILRERGLVVSRREGQFVHYQLSDRRIVDALDLLRAVMAENLKTRASLADSLDIE